MNINEEKLQNEKTVELKIDEHLDTAFPDGIPSNAIVSKGRCGIGGTTLELKTNRHSIITVPNVSIIKNKKKQFEDLIEVYGGVSVGELKKRMSEKLEEGGLIKIMSTPDSFYKIITASEAIHYDVYSSSHVLLDEFHSFVTEGLYRLNITRPLDYLWNFKNKTFMSTTPCKFSDPRFTEFDKIKIQTPHLNSNVQVIISKDVQASLIGIIGDIRATGYNLHIFYTSVTGIANVLPLLGQAEDVNVFCADGEENKDTLGEYQNLIKDVNEDDLVRRKINFYTTRYFEGWDLYDDKAIILLVSDVLIEHTCIDIATKGVQAGGRLRNKAVDLLHLTNTSNINSISREQIIEIVRAEADKKISFYNKMVEEFNFKEEGKQSFLSAVKSCVDNFAIFDPETDIAKIDYFKLDAEIYKKTALSCYNNRDSIVREWVNANFSVILKESNAQLSREEKRVLANSRTSRSEKIKTLFDKFKAYDEEKTADYTTTTFFGKVSDYFSRHSSIKSVAYSTSEINSLIKKNSMIYDYYAVVGYEEAERLEFNATGLRKAYIVANNDRIESSKALKELVCLEFRQGRWYSMHKIKTSLSRIYSDLKINKVVTAQFIKKFFKVVEKNMTIDGKRVKGFELLVGLL